MFVLWSILYSFGQLYWLLDVSKVVTMHRCIDTSRYLGRRYVYRIATQVSRYSHTWLLALFALFVAHTQRGLCCASFIVSFKGTFG